MVCHLLGILTLTTILFQILLSWVNNGDVEEEEVGQRILTALKQVSHSAAMRLPNRAAEPFG